MDASRLLKWVVIAAIVFAAWKIGIPWIRQQTSHVSSGSAASSPDNSCIAAANRASSAWGSGLGRFTNPPYDLDAWSTFSTGIGSKISDAESGCGCAAESCGKVRDAMRDLRSLLTELDQSIRNGTPPPADIVQRQDSIDSRIDEARDLVRAGK
jgi:hypothetical protein